MEQQQNQLYYTDTTDKKPRVNVLHCTALILRVCPIVNTRLSSAGYNVPEMIYIGIKAKGFMNHH